jgi:histidinol-phosphate aminotransferase
MVDRCGEVDDRATVVTRLARQCVLARKEYVPGKPIEEVRRELGIEDIIKMASNENPLGASPLALEAMINELRQSAHRYPESLCHDLVQKLAGVHGLKPGCFFIDNGADGVITMIGLSFIDSGDQVLMAELTFPAYENITTKMGGECVRVPLTPDHRLDVHGFIAAVTPKTKAVFLCNPNNPTGTIVTRPEFELLLSSLPETVLLVADEAYYDFADDPDYPQSVPYLSKHPNLIIIRTFSKIMGLAGVRVGYCMAHPAVIKVMLKAREPFPVSRPAQAGALAALDDEDFVQRTLQLNRQGRDQYYRAFRAMDLTYFPTQTNFVFVELGRPAEPVFQAMLRYGVVVRPVGSKSVPSCLRITIGTAEQNERTLSALAQVLAT